MQFVLLGGDILAALGADLVVIKADITTFRAFHFKLLN
jgi:hypothetical protein